MSNLPSFRACIKDLSCQGEGLAETKEPSLPHFLSIPFTLPGEEVDIHPFFKRRHEVAGKALQILNPSPERQKPLCSHYGTCGGCRLQHLTPLAYQRFKKTLVEQALSQYDLEASSVVDPILIGPQARRRIDLKAHRKEDSVILGFHDIYTRRLFNIKTCPVVHPDIEALFEPLRQVCEKLLHPHEMTHIFITRAANGLDVLLAGFKRPLSLLERQDLHIFGQDHNLLRLAYKVKRRQEIILEKEPPVILLGDHNVTISPYGFLQATEQTDQIFADFVQSNVLPTAQRVADLFCGRGTLSLALTQKGVFVTGFESDPHALHALSEVKDPRLSLVERNLFDTPLSKAELETYDMVVMNPPRSGAESQSSHLKETTLPRILYISCSATSFARDCSILREGGYRLTKVIPVDQFLWTPHIELMAVLEK